jgi:hypothetical protein
MNIFTFFDNLKEIFKFWAIGFHVKVPLPPPPPHPHRAPGQNWGGP